LLKQKPFCIIIICAGINAMSKRIIPYVANFLVFENNRRVPKTISIVPENKLIKGGLGK
jgi:hypothetical protein